MYMTSGRPSQFSPPLMPRLTQTRRIILFTRVTDSEIGGLRSQDCFHLSHVPWMTSRPPAARPQAVMHCVCARDFPSDSRAATAYMLPKRPQQYALASSCYRFTLELRPARNKGENSQTDRRTDRPSGVTLMTWSRIFQRAVEWRGATVAAFAVCSPNHSGWCPWQRGPISEQELDCDKVEPWRR